MNGVRVVAAGHEILDVGALAIAPGEHVAIVGPSGAGKSSLVGLLLGWHRPAVGTVIVDGRALGLAELEALRRRTVWVDPTVYLWNRSLASNLGFGLPAPPADLASAMTEADLDGVVGRLPQGAETPLGEAGGLLSGGEGQRVRFGRGVLRPEPALVILDEPFRGLARDQRAALLARARRRWSDATLLCVTHDIGETERFARVLVVADGKIVEDGAPGALRARPGSRYATLLEAEQRVRASSWSAAAWRRLRLERGRISEEDGAREEGTPG
jgi:ATP-binding cassette subfamily B protein